MKSKYQVNDTVYIRRVNTHDECECATVECVVVDEPDSIVYVLDTGQMLLEKNVHASEYEAHMALLQSSVTALGGYVSILEHNFQKNRGRLTPGGICVSDPDTGMWRVLTLEYEVNPGEVVHNDKLQASVYGVNIVVNRIRKQLDWLKDN